MHWLLRGFLFLFLFLFLVLVLLFFWHNHFTTLGTIGLIFFY
ncbi:MAG: hypothetical protein N7Q72_04260 [Spiroplasma sp. Tabriz.8]|nr:hypothetical protein [Spiroplasma sp. Tabriz.8]